MSPARANRTAVGVLAGIVVVAAALRFGTLDLQSFWVDEGATVKLLRTDFGGLLDGLTITEKTPPLYYLLAWLWTRPFGTGEIGVRSLSALIGVLTVPAAFALTRELVSERAGLVAAALVAVNPLLVWYSQEARAYALLVLLATLATLFAVRAVRAPEERRHVVWWAVTAALALATHYFAAFVVVPLAIWLLVRHEQRRGALVAIGAVGLMGLALLPLAIDQSENPGSNFITGTGLGTRVAQVPKQFLLGYDAPAEGLLTALAVALTAAALALAFLRTRGHERSGVLIAAGLLAAAMLLPLAAAAGGADFVIARNLIVGLVPLVVLTAAGFAAGSRAGLVLAAGLAAVSLVTVIGVFTRPEFQRDDWRGVAEAIGPATSERALVVNPLSGAVPLSLYLDVEPWGERFRPVDEIDLVAVNERLPGETPRPPRPRNPEIVGLALVERIDADTFTLIRMRADGLDTIRSQGLTTMRLGSGLAVTLRQRPSR